MYISTALDVTPVSCPWLDSMARFEPGCEQFQEVEKQYQFGDLYCSELMVLQSMQIACWTKIPKKRK